jgi:hypothetical protein
MERKVEVKRITGETDIKLFLDMDGAGTANAIQCVVWRYLGRAQHKRCFAGSNI